MTPVPKPLFIRFRPAPSETQKEFVVAKFLGSCLAIIVCACAASSASAAESAVVLPLERTTYVIGERVPIGVRSDERITLTLKAEQGAVARDVCLYEGQAGPLVLVTDRLAPGRYTLLLDGAATGPAIELISPLRDSPGAIVSEASLHKFRHPSLSPDAARKVGVDAYFAMGAQRAGESQNHELDGLLSAGVLSWIHPLDRVKSFEPPITWEYELGHFAQRLSLGAQANLRYPGFAGWCFHWDPAGFGRQPSIFFRYGKHEDAHDQYLAAARAAMREQFKSMTGLEAPLTEEYLRYVTAIGRPQWAPVIDLPSYKWAMRIAEHLPKLSEAEVAELQKRIEAWHRYLMGIYERTHRRYQQALDPIDPHMAHTGSVNLDHAQVTKGQYAPSAYQGLELREMSAWNDQIGHGDYDYQWLLSGALMDTRNPGNQPVWVAQYLGTAHSKYPGKLTRAIAHNLHNNGTGAGTTAENVVQIFGNYAKDDPRHQPEIAAARDFLNRFVALAVQGRSGGKVAVLYSRTQFSRERYQEMFGTRAWQAIVVLTRLGYTPHFITEQEIANGGLSKYRVLTLWEQTFDLPEDVTANIERWADAGGRVVADARTSIQLPGMAKMDKGVVRFNSRRVYGWSTPNANAYPGGMPEMSRRVFRELAPAVRRALGSTGLAMMHASSDPADALASVMQIDGGEDGTYLVVTNDSSTHSHLMWHEVREKLLPTDGAVPAGAQLYDVTEERHLGEVSPIDCDLTRTTARVYAVLPRALGDTELLATQRVSAGEPMRITCRVLDEDGRPLKAVVPLHISIHEPNGSTVFAGYRSTDREGRFALAFPTPINAPTGDWSIAVRVQLNGQRVTLPVQVSAASGDASLASATAEPVIVRQREAIVKLLAEGSGPLVAPVFAGQQSDTHGQLAEQLRKAVGDRVDLRIMSDPPMSTYTLAYVVSDAEQAENARIDNGEAIGKIVRRTHNRNDYFTDMGGYRFGRPAVLFDLVNVQGDNPLAERLAQQGLLWPRVSEAYPGKGRAVVQVVHDAFDVDKDAIVIQAADIEGLTAAVASLSDLPVDWVGTSVSAARLAMLEQLNIHGGAAMADIPKDVELSANGRRSTVTPEPFRMDFAHGTPPPADAFAEKQPPTYPAVDLPAVIEGADAIRKHTVSLQRGIEGGWFKSASTHGTGNTDLRFSEATMIPIELEGPTKLKITVRGTFRYSDRIPRSQGSWEQIISLYKKYVPRERRPLRWVVEVDDKTLGALTLSATAEKDVPIDTLPFYLKQKPPSVVEEVATELTGTFDLPAGRHEVRLVYENMIDGELTGVSITEAK